MELQLGSTYNKQSVAHALNICNFPEDYRNKQRLRLQAIQYLLQYRNQQGSPRFQELQNIAVRMFDEFERERNIEGCREMTDVIYRFFPSIRNQILNRLRVLSNPTPRVITKTIYADTQNVHTTTLNKSVLKSVEKICRMHAHILTDDEAHKECCIENIRIEFVKLYPDKAKLIYDAINYINHSISKFDNITLRDIFISVWIWIHNHEHSKELELRLLEELKEMNGMCTTGHLARIANVIQGFTDDTDLMICISNKEQYTAIVKHYLEKSLKECRDEKVVDGMSEQNVEYSNFVKGKIAQKIPYWVKEYGEDINKYISKIVKDYTQVEL